MALSTYQFADSVVETKVPEGKLWHFQPRKEFLYGWMVETKGRKESTSLSSHQEVYSKINQEGDACSRTFAFLVFTDRLRAFRQYIVYYMQGFV